MQTNDDNDDSLRERPWIHWETTYEIETWMDACGRELAKFVKEPLGRSHGICFVLEAGGEIFMHTTSEGIVLIDVPPEAEWITPVITAATQIPASRSQIWVIPVEKLTQLLLGLSSLIKSTRLVVNHPFKMPK